MSHLDQIKSEFSAFDPPKELNAKGRSFWRQCLTARRRDLWDAPALALLGMLCRLWAEWERLQDRLEHIDPDAPEYGNTLRQVDLLAARCAGISTKLRLTPQAIDKKRAAVGRGGPSPINWGA